jgi:hypothetical protein
MVRLLARPGADYRPTADPDAREKSAEQTARLSARNSGPPANIEYRMSNIEHRMSNIEGTQEISNIEHRISNTEVWSSPSVFDIRCSIFDIRYSS